MPMRKCMHMCTAHSGVRVKKRDSCKLRIECREDGRYGHNANQLVGPNCDLYHALRASSQLLSPSSLGSAGSSNSTSSVSMSAAEQGMVRPSWPVMYQWLHQVESSHTLHKTRRNSCDRQVSSIAGGSELRSALIHLFLSYVPYESVRVSRNFGTY